MFRAEYSKVDFKWHNSDTTSCLLCCSNHVTVFKNYCRQNKVVIVFGSESLHLINFSNSLIIHQVQTKKITTVKEVWISDLN